MSKMHLGQTKSNGYSTENLFELCGINVRLEVSIFLSSLVLTPYLQVAITTPERGS